MPASSLSKIALHLSRFASFQAQQAGYNGANAFKSGLGSGSTAGSLGSAGAGAGSGAGSAKFQAGRSAHFTYTVSCWYSVEGSRVVALID